MTAFFAVLFVVAAVTLTVALVCGQRSDDRHRREQADAAAVIRYCRRVKP